MRGRLRTLAVLLAVALATAGPLALLTPTSVTASSPTRAPALLTKELPSAAAVATVDRHDNGQGANARRTSWHHWPWTAVLVALAWPVAAGRRSRPLPAPGRAQSRLGAISSGRSPPPASLPV